ncbi:lipocalin family protein [Daejeonella oryzae]|uniref:lipocalin family protein n=1 Tax=Daejeonella oryzae TaxID=1122943 RepID=UPI00047D5DED|nr:lipocalin family protein [Daejeonella oryzae]
MKKIVYSIAILFTAFTVLTSCSSTKVAESNTFSRGKISGTWTLNSINYEGIVENAVQTVFDQGPVAEFQGSTWQLSNNGQGSYSLANGSVQPIYWSYINDGMTPTFQFKKLADGVKAKDVAAGYKMVVASADGSNLTLKAPVQYDGKTGYIVYSFAKK